MELRLQIKQWERDFEKSSGRKPQQDDIKANPEIYQLYKKYKREKQAALGAKDPKKSKSKPKPDPSEAAKEAANSKEQAAPASPQPRETIESPPGTPEPPQPLEILPTPQLGGRTLGLFDLKMTPTKTPQRQIQVATPTSRRTPSYLRQRDSPMKSPMRARRRYKSISELSSKFEDEAPTMSLDEIAKFSLVSDPSKDKDTQKDNEGAPDKKKKFKKAVIRPVLESDVPVTSKAGDNFQRLNIQKRGFKGKKR